jgi:DnaK suppressor protein
MPVRKSVSKKKKSTTRKKSAAKKAAGKKSASKKKARSASAKKKPASKKKTAAKKPKTSSTRKTKPAAKKKVAKKTATKGKKTSKKASKKAASGKTVTTKKAAAKKSTATKAPARKSTAKKTAAKTAARKTAPKSESPARAAAAPARPTARPIELKASTNLLNGPLRGFSPYQPKRGEEYMSEAQLAHFREILLAWKRELMEEVDRTVLHMKDDAANFPDPNDRATQESEFGLELRTRDRERKLLRKIDSALSRIDEGTYGYCEETGDEIGLRRLEARPVATLCVEAQERRELAERQFRDREDYYR